MKRVSLVLIIVLSSMFIIPFSTPISGHLVVVMADDQDVNQAVEVLKQEVPNAIVVRYGSLEYILLAHRVLGKVIWVSHGSKEGISVWNHLIPWVDFSSRITMTPSKDVILACESSSIYEYVKESEVLAFQGVIDAVLSALIVSFLLVRAPAIIDQIVDRACGLISGEATISALYAVGQLSWVELAYWLAISMLVLASAVFSYYTDFGFWQTVGYLLISTGKWGIIVTLVWLHQGWIDPLTAASKIVGFMLGTMVGTMVSALSGNWFALAIFYACVIATLVSWGASAGSIAVAKIVLAFAAGLAFLVGLAIDFFDANTWVG